MLRSLFVALFSLAPVIVAAPLAQAAGNTDCYNPDAALTVEERRLDRAVPQEILRRSDFDRFAAEFAPALCLASSQQQARVVVLSWGNRLWQRAVETAQGKRPARGLPATDDRPLYWARLQLTSLLRQWRPRFELASGDRAELLATTQRTSRGLDSVRFSPDHRLKSVLISGFDPFILDADIRRSNPSGSAALALDGALVQTSAGLARVEATMFPVLWGPFSDGMVEHAFRPHLADGARQVDMFTTVSQGRPERFDVERYNGRWRGGFQDNDNVSATGPVPIPPGVPTVRPVPEFTESTLPAAAMTAADTGRFPVDANRGVVEIPAGGTDPVFQPEGPTPGSTARAGSGGDYLSNEIAYRATLLRDALEVPLAGGHLHTPVLKFGDGNTTAITDPVLERNRQDIIAQVRALLAAAASALATTNAT